MTARLGLFVSALACVLAIAGSSRADVPPPDACTMPGQPCDNAGEDGDEPGTCMESECTRTVPDGDGGFDQMTYDCNLCKAGGGASGSGGSGKPSGSAGTGDDSSDKAEESSGCSAAHPNGGAFPVSAAFAALALLLARRSRLLAR